MANYNTWFEMRWTLRRKWFSVWDVRDYYTNLERRAEAGAEITYGYVLMVIVSALLATGGLLLNSPAIVIGSMCVAPFLGSSRAVCIGGLFRNRRVFLLGLVKQLFGLLIIGAGIAYIITVLLHDSIPMVQITPEILPWAMPATQSIVLSILVAVSAGAGASLALTADPKVVETPWGQVIDAVIGVEIAISLIPPAAAVGIGLAFGRLDISYNALLLMVVNVLGLDIFGSMFMLVFRGIRYKYLLMEKKIRHAVESALVADLAEIPNEFAVNVTLLGENVATIHVRVENQQGEKIPETLAQSIGTHVYQKTHFKSEVSLEIIPIQVYSTI
ncbi:MAG: DUF389 domain-containing protein [Anaerolineales bacterium]|jgi:uncharacterized hydrophobic protein (TIGR00271 family)